MLSRDDIIRLMEWHPSFDRNQTDGLLARIEKVAQAAAAAEREACAKLVEPDDEHRRHAAWAYLGGKEGVEMLDGIAAAIRARGQPDPKVTHLNDWARDRLARHGIQIPEDEEYGNPSF
jgi:hypothetical protein